MKQTLNFFCFIALLFLTTSCGTLIGGAKYHAHVEVTGHPNARIYYNGTKQGVGNAEFLVKRHHANKLTIQIKEDGCPDYSHKYNSKVPRLGPVLGTVSEITQMLAMQAIGIPVGTLIDLITGGYVKPDVSHPDITKMDYDNFKYTVDYPNCNKHTNNSNDK